jgi:gamma-glutamyltranspeptidase / glutathione hydrolase
VVAAGHPLSARAGAEALARGGNAVDAVCAAAFAAAVAESPLTGPGAGGFLLSRAPGGATTLLDFFVAAPGLGPRGRALEPGDLDSFTVPFGGAEQVFHIGPASVAVPGMVAGLGEAARRLGRLPLADVVEPAVRLAREGVVLSRESAYLHAILADMLTASPACAAVYAPGGRLLGEGDLLRAPDLGETLRHIGEAGPDTMRHGPLAAALVAHLAEAGGLVTADDLRDYRVIDRAPLRIDHGAVTVLTNPPPSSGGALIAAALRALAVPVPVGGAVDAEGGMASLSSSNGSGSGVMAPGTGVLLNNMLGEEDLNPGGFGRLPAGIRMTSMMAPSLVLRGGEPVIALGSAGSNRLRSAILQTLVSMVDGGMAAPEAVRRPRVHPEGDGVDVEGGVPEDAVAALIADGHRLRRWGEMNLFFGGVSVAGRGRDGLEGAGDPRRGGGAAAVTRAGEVIAL